VKLSFTLLTMALKFQKIIESNLWAFLSGRKFSKQRNWRFRIGISHCSKYHRSSLAGISTLVRTKVWQRLRFHLPVKHGDKLSKPAQKQAAE